MFPIIQPAILHDLDDMVLLLQQLFGIEKDFHFDAGRQRKGLELLLDSTRSIIMVAKEQDSVIGMATGQLVISTAEGGPSLLVEDVVVKVSRQNEGIGSRLLQGLGEWGAERGAGRMQLLADRTNSSALNFYHGQGWQPTKLICLRKFHSEKEWI
jgi:ribosomal protein S18 acetylase RimI-like enzyme